MLFDLEKQKTDSIINYYYENYTFQEKDIQKTIESDHFIKRIFLSKQPNISSSLFETNYKSITIYITKKIHFIKNKDFDGELIIEHIPQTNGFTKFYICIPLKTVTGYHSILTDFIEKKENIEFDMNTILPKSSIGVLYSSGIFPFTTRFSDNVLLFTEPILVGNDFSNFETVDLFQSFSESYQLISIEKYSKPLIEGNRNIKLTSNKSINPDTLTGNLYCKPADMLDDKEADIATISIPMGGVISKNDSTTIVVGLAQNFGLFFIVLIGLWLLVPIGYKAFIIDLINKSKDENDRPVNIKIKANKLYASDIFYTLFFVILSISFIYSGVASSRPNLSIVGFFVFISFIIMFIRIQYLKHVEFPDEGFKGFIQKNFGSSAFTDDDISKMTPDIAGSWLGSLKSIVKEKQLLTVIILFLFIYGIIQISGLRSGSSSEQMVWAIVIFIFSICVGIYAASTVPNAGINTQVASSNVTVDSTSSTRGSSILPSVTSLHPLSSLTKMIGDNSKIPTASVPSEVGGPSLSVSDLTSNSSSLLSSGKSIFEKLRSSINK